MTEYTITREDAERDLRALRGALSGIPVGVSSSIVPALNELIESIEEQVKPQVEEPAEFGSIIWATNADGEHKRWMRGADALGHPWVSELDGEFRHYGDLTHVEVLRIGVGEVPSESQRAAQDDAYLRGFNDVAMKMRRDLIQLKSSANTALAMVAALLGES